MAEQVFIKNQSRRLYVIGGVNLAPTQALGFDKEFAQAAGVQHGIEIGELAMVDKEIEPITTEEEALAENERRKKQGPNADSNSPAANRRRNRA